MCKSSARNDIRDIKLDSGQVVVNKLDIAESFNKYYVEIGKFIAEQIISSNNSLNAFKIYFNPTNDMELFKAIKQLKPKKALSL